MSQPVNSSPSTPIYLCTSSENSSGKFAIDAVCLQENLDRLSEAKIDPSRIHVINIKDLDSVLSKIHSKAILIIPGGLTIHLAWEMKPFRDKIIQLVDEGLLNIWGQCSGANLLCNNVYVKDNNEWFSLPAPMLVLIPLDAYTPAYEGEASYRLADLNADTGKSFQSFWSGGSYFKDTPNRKITELKGSLLYTSDKLIPPLHIARLAHYRLGAEAPAAIFCARTIEDSVIIGEGVHVEGIKIPTNANQTKSLTEDKGRDEMLKRIYRLLGIQ